METTPPGSEEQALEIARILVASGVPLFVAPPDEKHSCGFRLPKLWETSVPTPDVVNRWRPGWALAAVCGHTADVLDVDPRNGGDASASQLRAAGVWPAVYGQVATPSGGQHDWIAPLHVGKGQPAPGIDLQGGRPDGTGRGFVFLPPTVRRSKVDGLIRPYRWIVPPDLTALTNGHAPDVSGAAIASLVRQSAPRVTDVPGAVTAPADAIVGPREAAYADRVTRDVLYELARAVPGQRNAIAFRVAARLHELINAGWLDGSGTWERFRQVANQLDRSDDPFPLTEATQVWLSAQSRVAGARAVLPASTIGGEVIPLASAPGHGAGASTGMPETSGPSISTPEFIAPVSPAPAPTETDLVADLIARMVDTHTIDSVGDLEPLIPGWLDLDTLARIYGPPGGGKSFVALDLAACIATGTPWHGYEVRQGSVVYLAAEGGRGIRRRLRAWEKANGKPAEGLMILPEPIQADPGRGQWQIWIEACRRIGPTLIIMDTQARITVGMDENSPTEMGVIVDQLEMLRQQTGACVLLVHHTGVNEMRARGSNAILAALQTELHVVRQDSSLVVETDRQKDSEESPPLGLTMTKVDLGTDAAGQPVDSIALTTALTDVTSISSTALTEEKILRSASRMAEVLAEVFSGGLGGTKAEIKAITVGEKGLMKASAFYAAWSEIAERGVIAKIKGSQRWRYVPVDERDKLIEPIDTKDGKPTAFYAPM